MRVCNLSSGSKGNCTYVETDNHKILIDIGTSSLYVEKSLKSIGVDPSEIDIILVTHAHIDHVSGLRVFTKKYNPLVYISDKILKEANLKIENVVSSTDVDVNDDIKIKSIRLSHDVTDIKGYLIEDKNSNTINKFEKEIELEMPFLNFVPKIFISAKTKQRLVNIYKLSKEVYEQATKRVTTSLLNKIVLDAISMNPPVSIRGKRLKLFYSVQVKTQPPTFVLFINNEDFLKDNYVKYLENKLRESFGFKGTPIRITAKEKKENKK